MRKLRQKTSSMERAVGLKTPLFRGTVSTGKIGNKIDSLVNAPV